MDAISLIIAALVAGAAAGTTDTTSAAIKDTYLVLRNLIKRRFGGAQPAEMALDQYAVRPETWEAPLRESLEEHGVADDEEIVELATQLLKLSNEGHVPSIAVVGSQGVQIGDRNKQKNRFKITR
jgi:hypothetical protein